MKLFKKILFSSLIITLFIFMIGCNEGNKDTIKPTVVINNPTTATAGDEIVVDYVVSDDVTDVSKLEVTVTIVKDGQIINAIDNKFIAEEGIYTIKITAKDEAGNLGLQIIDIVVNKAASSEGDTTKPMLFVTLPDVCYAGEEVVIDYVVSDNASFKDEIVVDVVVKKDNEAIEVSDNKFVAQLGEYEVSVTATDKAGNQTLIIKNILAKIDDVSPIITVEEISDVAVGDTLKLNYKVSDNVSDVTNIKTDILLVRGEVSRSISGDIININTEGDYKIIISSYDEVGNVATKEVLFSAIKEREDRNLNSLATPPSNVVTEDKFINAPKDFVYESNNIYYMLSDKYCAMFVNDGNGYYVTFNKKDTFDIMFTMPQPIIVHFRSGQANGFYETVEITEYGILAIGRVTAKNGSIVRVEDRYYYPDNDSVTSAINVQRALIVENAVSTDRGYQSVFAILTTDNNPQNLDWFIPNNVFGELPTTSVQNYLVYRETLTGLPMVMFRDKTTGYSISIARYQPVIDYSSNSYACVGAFEGSNTVNSNSSSIEINYPTRDTARRYFDLEVGTQNVYDMTIMADITDNFEMAMINAYNNQYLLEDVRIVNTDIDECYKVINEDFKDFYLVNTRNGITSYGLPWRVTLENGKIGPASYQAGFVGQQIPCAYNMMLYGLKYNDPESLQNGINVINFWLHDINMMSPAGVPKIWYDGVSNRWLGYPTFTRMAVDAMEGLFDAYRLATAYGIKTEGWIEAVTSCAEWFVRCQNGDGSWYRCYNYEGTYYKGNESNITWNPGDITRSTSKNNSTMPVRFLGKMYEFTGEAKYLNAIKKAGDFIYEKLYPEHAYFGGTCDNPDCMDKEAGVYAMYAFDTLYMLTGDTKWLECLEQATIFTMSSVITVSFKISENASDLKAAYSLQCGYTDGLSYITCKGTSVDNYAAYIYYQVLKVYIHTGKEVYYKMAEFIQQNTKSTMDWDGLLDYAYKSLTPEASTIYSFGYASATDDDNVMGVWLPWQSAANAEPIAKMYDTFGFGDVKLLKDKPIEELRAILKAYGVGGNPHRKF